jgi:hypothetical protein
MHVSDVVGSGMSHRFPSILYSLLTSRIWDRFLTPEATPSTDQHEERSANMFPNVILVPIAISTGSKSKRSIWCPQRTHNSLPHRFCPRDRCSMVHKTCGCSSTSTLNFCVVLKPSMAPPLKKLPSRVLRRDEVVAITTELVTQAQSVFCRRNRVWVSPSYTNLPLAYFDTA